MKIEIRLGQNPIEEQIKSVTTDEKLIYASPCLLKYQEDWFNEIIPSKASEKLSFYDGNHKLAQDEMIALYVKSLLHVQFVSNGLSFLDWWSDLLDLSAEQKEKSISILKTIGIGKEKLENRWSEMKFHQKIFIILAPASTKYKTVHLFLGDYFLEQNDLEIFSNQIHSFLSATSITLILFWTLSLRNLKGHRLYFSGFNGEKLSEK